MKYKIKDVAEMAGISVRTLHHYDQIGLLEPQTVTEKGYRIYSDTDLAQLQQILFLKELDFPLKEIGKMMKSSDFHSEDTLLKQKTLLLEKRDRLNKIISTIDKTIASQKEGKTMSKNEMFDAFDMKEIEEHQKKYAAELEEKYGNSDAFQESSRKTKNYKKEDWAVIKAEADEIYRALVEKMDLDPADPSVQEVIGRWQQHITDRFYNCTKEILAGLGETYVDDSRFTKNIDKYGEGVSVFFRDAIRVYCS